MRSMPDDTETAVSRLTALDPSCLTVEQLQQAVTAVTRLADRLGGWADLAVGELGSRAAGQVPAADGDGRAVPVQAWLRDSTRCGGHAAGSQVRLAAALRTLPLLATAVADGRVGRAHAAVLTRLVGKIDPEPLDECQPQLIELASGRDPEALAVWVREQIATHCEPVLEQDQRTAANKRYLQTRNNHDGTVRGSFVLPSEEYETVATVLEPLARSTGLADGRSAGQRRADALVDVFGQVLRSGELPDAGGHRPQLSYLLPAGWAAGQPPAGLAQQLDAELGAALVGSRAMGATAVSGTANGTPSPSAGCTPSLPGGDQRLGATLVGAKHTCATAAWTGPQTRSRIETILCDARISRVLLDQTGQVRGLHSLTDSITPSQRRALAARDTGCAARGCTQPPAMCDAHHLISREDGGPTTLDNLVLLCCRHHVMWHQGRLQLRDLHVPWLTVRATGPPGHR